MPDPLKVECPHCGGSLKLKDRSAEGKKVRCPKCEEVFKVQLPAEDVDEFDDFSDDLGGEDEFQDEEEAPRRGKGAGKNSKKPVKKKRKSGGSIPWLIIAIACVALLAVGGLGFVVVKFAGGGGGANKIDLTYILPDTDIVVQIKMNQLISSPLLASLVTQLEAAPSPIPGMGIKDMESLTFGAYADKAGAMAMPMGGPMGGPMGMSSMNSTTRAMVVIRTKIAMKPEEISKTVFNGAPHTHNSKTYYKKANGEMMGSLAGSADSVYFPEPMVAVIASETDIKTIIDQGSKQHRRKDLDFINPDMTVIMAVVQKGTTDPNTPIKSPASQPKLQSLERAVNKSFKSLAFGTKITDKVDIEILANCSDSVGAGEIKTAVDGVFADLKSQYEKSKTMLTLMDMTDVMSLADKALASLKVTQSGTQVVAVATIPSELKLVAENMQKKMSGMMGGGGLGASPAGFAPPTGTSGGTTPDPSQLPPGFPPPTAPPPM